MSLQTKLEVQGAVQQWAASFLSRNQVETSDMIDALNNVMIQLKDQLITELIIEQQQQLQSIQEKGIEDEPSN